MYLGFIQENKENMPTCAANCFLLLYGSQTGQAKAIAEEIAEKAERQNLQANIHCLSLTEKKFFIEREQCVVIVTSTTGDGEPPDTALKFVRRLRKKTLADDYLSHLNYTLLGLGDSNYTNFCNCGKSVDKRLQDLGASRFYDSGWADDAVGLEVAVEPWIDGLFPALKRFLDPCGANSGDRDSDSVIIGHNSVLNSDSLLNDFHTIENMSMSTVENGQNKNQSNSSNIAVSSLTADLTKSNNENQSDLNNSTPDEPSSSVCDSKNSSTVVNQATSSAIPTNLSAKTESGTEMNISDLPSEKCLEACITVSVPPLSESTLIVPFLPPPFLQIEYLPAHSINIHELPRQNGCPFPSASTPVTMATLSDIKTLTRDTAVKKAMLVELDITGCDIKYQPGDAFSLICPNEPKEVEALLNRLNVGDRMDTCVKLSVIENTKKRNASVPKFITETSTLRHIFSTCLDIRDPPRKALVRVLLEYTSDDTEQRRLQELCSKQGNEDYAKFIRGASLSVLDILNLFGSCNPPVQTLIEHMPRLQPRPYSVCASPDTSPGKLQFVFNVVEMAPDYGRTYFRKGVCTGWLEGMAHSLKKVEQISPQDAISQGIKTLQISDIKIPVFGRTNQCFHLPDDVTLPVILIGPGTGVAPFIGYLDHRGSQIETQEEAHFGDILLVCGFRHKERDYLFKEEIEHHLSKSTLNKLLVNFSRDDQPTDAPRYVQDSLRSHGAEVIALLEEQCAVVYVCGDAKHMAKDVNQAFIDIYSRHKGISADEAQKLVMKLRLDRRYREDVWT